MGAKSQTEVGSKSLAETGSVATTTLAQTQKMLAQIFSPSLTAVYRNQAARRYFHNVYHLPTTLQKMSATEAFLQSADAFQRSIGRDPGTVERLTPNELEHWLTTEFLSEDFVQSQIGLGFLYPRAVVPPGLVSRGPEFAGHFKNRTSCLSGHIKEGIAEKKVSLNYGTSCGNTYWLGSVEGCDSSRKRVVNIQNEDVQVCADHGTDACCARHDLIRTGININALATFSSCKANNALHDCLTGVQPNQVFTDQRDISELQANTAARCIYQVMPCLAQTRNKFYEINFKTKKAPHVRSMYPEQGDHHVQVVFPFDHSYGDDYTDESSVYRERRNADFEYSHWKHIDPPEAYYGREPSTFLYDTPHPGEGWSDLE